MKYASLKNDIINLLHSSDYNLFLKFYDTDGQTTLDTEDCEWCYVSNYNIMIKFMDDDNSVIEIWKGTETLDDNMKHMLQRIRELTGLNGVTVQIRVYNDLNQRKIYNLVKNDIMKREKSEEMNESQRIDDTLIKALTEVVSVALSTKKPSDFYLSEAMQLENTRKIYEEMIKEISSLNKLKNINITESFQPLTLITSENTLSQIKEFVKNLSNKKKIAESSTNIKNIAKFVKNKYLHNCITNENKKPTLFVLENVKVYETYGKSNRDNLINAYNKLLSLTTNASKGTDIIREIRNNKICEEYNVTRKELIDFWLSKDNKKIDKNVYYVIENYNGDEIVVSSQMKNGLETLAQYFNQGGSKDDYICKNIMEETVKYNQISDFIKRYKDDYKIRKYIPKFKNIFVENANKLREASLKFSRELFETVEDIDYTKQYNKLCKEMGIEHPAIKYLAIENAKRDAEYCAVLMEETLTDEEILTEGLKPYVKNPFTLYNIVRIIMDKQILVNKVLNENVSDNLLESAKSLYNKICNDDNIVLTAISSSLFNLLHTKNLTESKKTYLQTLLKYV